jgi:hypothetical protein
VAPPPVSAGAFAHPAPIRVSITSPTTRAANDPRVLCMSGLPLGDVFDG